METAAATISPNPTWRERLLARCSRETSSGRFIPQIDGLRSLAVLVVVFFHLEEQLGRPAAGDGLDRVLTSVVRRGYLGVPIFFAISAFIVALPFAQHWLNGARKVGIGPFYLRRLTRLEPPYFFNLILLWLVGAALGYFALAETAPGLLASLLYQHNQVFGHFSAINSVAWSLEVEFQFYLLAPLLTLVFGVRPGWLRWLVLALAGGVLVVLRDQANRRVELSLLGQFEAFVAGLVVVDVYLTRWRGQLPARAVWDALGLLGWIGFFGCSGLSNQALRAGVATACLIAALLGSLGGVWLARVFGNRWVFTFGGMCYSYYLWHQALLMELVPRLQRWLGLQDNHPAQFAAVAAISLPVVLVCCTALFIWVEKPFMRRDWPQRLRGWLTRRFRRG